MDENIWVFAEVMFIMLVSCTGIYISVVIVAMHRFSKKLDVLKSKLESIDDKIMLR